MEDTGIKKEIKFTDNELIAAFMGFRKTGTSYHSEGQQIYQYLSEDFGLVYPAEFAFDRKWDWLMPVVEKINEWGIQGYGVFWVFEITATYVRINAKGLNFEHTEIIRTSGIFQSPIQAVYKTVVEFIKWYNTNQQKQ